MAKKKKPITKLPHKAYFTLRDLMAATGKRTTTLSRVCVRLGLSRDGRDWVLSRDQAELVIRALHERPGNPNFGPSKKAKGFG